MQQPRIVDFEHLVAQMSRTGSYTSRPRTAIDPGAILNRNLPSSGRNRGNFGPGNWGFLLESGMPDWEELVHKAQGGDLDAFDALVGRFRDMAVGYAYSILRDFPLAEDAAQEAFVQAYRDLGSLRYATAFPSWLRRIVFKHCDRLKRRKSLPTAPIEAAGEVREEARSPLEEIEDRETNQAVIDSIRALPRHERAAVTLFYINGYSMNEVGEFLDVPAATVKSRLHSARQKLKERMVAMVQDTLRQHAPGAEFNERVRTVLEKVPVVSFELHQREKKDGLAPCPESMPFPSCLRAFLEFRGDGLGFEKISVHGREWRLDNTHVFLLGTTGAAFRLSWRPGWHMDNPLLTNISSDPMAPYHRGIESVGYSYEVIQKEPGRDNETYFRERIIESIRSRGNPVIATGIVGPPVECLITGFDEAGEVLIGWSFFQHIDEVKGDIEYEPGGYFRKRRWFDDAGMLIVLGERRPRRPLEALYREALEWALTVARTPSVDGRRNGFAAYEAWAAAILEDSEFEGRPMPELRHRYHAHQDAVGTIAEGRWYAHNFLHRIAADIPAPPALEQAAICYDAQHSLMWQVWGLVGGYGDSEEHASRFVDSAVRKQTAELILQARAKDVEAAERIEEALRAWPRA
jgi:RNA polymerase sigma factor (sigma-70 family)